MCYVVCLISCLHDCMTDFRYSEIFFIFDKYNEIFLLVLTSIICSYDTYNLENDKLNLKPYILKPSALESNFDSFESASPSTAIQL